jgi:putative two-component system response regulator
MITPVAFWHTACPLLCVSVNHPSPPKGYRLDRRRETGGGVNPFAVLDLYSLGLDFLGPVEEGEVTMTATVLIVDADPSNCANWEALLLSQGCDVIAARSGEAALTLCPVLQPDLVLLNDFLPDIHGLEVCRRLKANPRNRLTPVVLVTATENASFAAKARTAGADDFWGLPPTPWEALSRVQSLLQLKTYIDEQAEFVIFSLTRSIEARDPYDGGHGARVSSNAVRFGKSLGLGQGDLETLRIGGLVHDIGKIVISDSILSKPGSLDSEETRIVEQHPIIGEQICAPLKSFRHVLPLIRNHHERMNGTGYPDGLRGEQIPLTVRILQIVDICDALTSNRSYRESLSLPRALIVLYEEANRGWLDEALLSHFASLMVGSESSVALGNRGRLRSLQGAKWSASASTAPMNRRRG